MKFTLEINCDNAAFADDREGEIARILTDLAAEIDAGMLPLLSHHPVRDGNGNKVGFAILK